MKSNHYLKVVSKTNLLFLLLTVWILPSHAQNSLSRKHYKASVFTPPNEFTSGIEGPAVDKNGILYVVNFDHKGTIGQVNSAGKSSLFIELPDGSAGNGIRFDSEGTMLIADYTKHNILEVNMSTKVARVMAHEPQMSQPNDIAIDHKNRLYASDPDWKTGNGRVWRIDTNGQVMLIQDNMGTTNGIELSPHDKILYVNESVQRKVWAFDISPDGDLMNKRLMVEFSDFGMDGMRCDIKGNLYITRHGKGTVVKVSPKGKILKEIKLSGQKPSNIAFGGTDGRTVFVTLQDQGNIESFRVPSPGRAWLMKNQKQK